MFGKFRNLWFGPEYPFLVFILVKQWGRVVPLDLIAGQVRPAEEPEYSEVLM